MEKRRKQDEFDLYDLFIKSVNIIRSNFWIIVLFFVIGTALGLASYYSSPKVYESKMVVSSAILTKSYSKALIDKLNRHRRERNSAAIMSLLHVSEETAKKVARLDVENVSQLDENKEADRFMITAEVLDQQILPELQKGLVYYLENNEFVKVRVEQNEKYLKQVVAKFDEEIKDMEEWKEKIMNGDFFQRVQGNVMFDPTTVNSKILELTKEKIKLQNDLELVNSVQIIEGFTMYEIPVRPRLSVSMISGSFVGLVLVSIFIIFKSVRRILKMADEAKVNA